MNANQYLGVMVMPEYYQCESIDKVIRNLLAIGATAVATSPYVMELADEQTGAREPPQDAGAGKVRLLDRPLWGRRELWMRTSPSFVPQQQLYQGLRYQPQAADALTKTQGPLVAEFIDQAQAAGLEVFFQVQSAIPPGYRVQFGGPEEDDAPRLPDGRLATNRVDKNGSLASEHILQYQDALIREICSQYPQLDGIRFDWPEYPPYHLDSVFFDFSPWAEQAARRLGYDFDALRNSVGQLYSKLNGGLTNEDLQQLAAKLEADEWRADSGALPEAWEQWLRFKADLSSELLQRFRQTMNDAGAAHMKMAPNAFPPPWSRVSGFDFTRAAQHSDSMSVKLYGMHWAMMLRSYGDQILAANAGLNASLLVRVLERLLDIVDAPSEKALSEYRYPAPDEPHPAGEAAQIRKVGFAQKAAGDTPVRALVHSYGPNDDFKRRVIIGRRASRHGIWINRYGYLSDEKIALLRDLREA